MIRRTKHLKKDTEAEENLHADKKKLGRPTRVWLLFRGKKESGPPD